MKQSTRFISLATACVVILAASVSASCAAEKKKEKRARPRTLVELNRDLIELTRRTLPSVVNISAVKNIAADAPMMRFRIPDQKQPDAPRKRSSIGSGVIIDARGYIITNNHVIKNTKGIEVTLSDKRVFKCTVVGADPATDIAVIRIADPAPKDLPVAVIGDSDAIRVGEIVIAIGNPFGFAQTVTMGIVSATGRQNIGLASYENFIQTDAAINPGNSGGALVNVDGVLVGINTAIFSRSGGSIGIGFAIPAKMVKQVMSELISSGRVVRGWLGVYIQDVTKDIADSIGFARKGGAMVSDIMKGSPAEGSGVAVGDIIVSVNGGEIRDVDQLRKLIAALKPDSVITLGVFRGGKTSEVKIKIGAMPDEPQRADTRKTEADDELGMAVRDVDEALAYKYKVADGRGVVIVAVKAGSPAGKAGLIEGDLIKEVDQRPVGTAAAYRSVLATLKTRTKVLLLVKRQGMNKFVVINRGPKE